MNADVRRIAVKKNPELSVAPVVTTVDALDEKLLFAFNRVSERTLRRFVDFMTFGTLRRRSPSDPIAEVLV